MKVIKQGVIPEMVPVQARCTHCDTIVEFTSAEVERVYDQRGGDYYRWICPVCNKNNSTGVPRKLTAYDFYNK